jgi:hypothetical protein
VFYVGHYPSANWVPRRSGSSSLGFLVETRVVASCQQVSLGGLALELASGLSFFHTPCPRNNDLQ